MSDWWTAFAIIATSAINIMSSDCLSLIYCTITRHSGLLHVCVYIVYNVYIHACVGLYTKSNQFLSSAYLKPILSRSVI